MSDTAHITWIAVDWGTTNLRAWGMQGGSVQARAQSGDGMGTLTRDGFGPALGRLISHWDVPGGTPIIACGMVGSRQGWVEAPYRTVPATPLGDSFASTTTDSHPVHIIAGLKQDTPPDVMRGEETQIAGFLALNPGWDGIVCLPGTHTKWAEVSAGEVISFQTFMSGEMFALLSEHSVLRHSVATDDWDKSAFEAAVSDALSRPEKLAAALFGIRANDLLAGTAAATSRSRLSGLLIGAEFSAARPYWLGRQIALIGGASQSQLYADALAAQGVPATVADAERMTLAGLTAAYRSLKEPS